MFTPTLKTATNRCTKRCTEVLQLARTTLFLGDQMHRMPLKMLAVESVHWSVAPNVAGSIPVSHPKLIECSKSSKFSGVTKLLGGLCGDCLYDSDVLQQVGRQTVPLF
jgi:hypothetical protein